MKAVTVHPGAPGSVRYEEVPEPEPEPEPDRWGGLADETVS